MTNEEFIKSVSLEGEIWRDVVGYEGIYMVSNLGRVATLSHSVSFLSVCNGVEVEKTFNAKQCLRKPHIGKHGYVEYILRDSKRIRLFKVHRLVAEAFIPNPQKLPAIDHIDRDKQNNCVSNLRWCNQSLNMQNPLTKAVMSDVKSKPVVCIYPDNKTKTFKSAYIARFDGFDPSSITKVCKNKKSSHKGCRWMYLSNYETQANMSKNS